MHVMPAEAEMIDLPIAAAWVRRERGAYKMRRPIQGAKQWHLYIPVALCECGVGQMVTTPPSKSARPDQIQREENGRPLGCRAPVGR